jgi:hypothetical protein
MSSKLEKSRCEDFNGNFCDPPSNLRYSRRLTTSPANLAECKRCRVTLDLGIETRSRNAFGWKPRERAIITQTTSRDPRTWAEVPRLRFGMTDTRRREPMLVRENLVVTPRGEPRWRVRSTTRVAKAYATRKFKCNGGPISRLLRNPRRIENGE